MMRRYAALAILPALVAVGCEHSNSPSTSATSTFLAPLAPLQVQPLLAISPVLPTGSVTMGLNLTMDEDQKITAATGGFSGTFSNLPSGAALTAAHVNVGAAGATGPVVIGLNILPGQVTFAGDGTATLTTTMGVDPTVASQIVANPAAFYFQADTALFPDGILRGQFSALTVSPR